MAATNCTREIAEFYQLTQSRLARIWERDNKRCHWCDIETVLTKHEIPNQATMDHVIPKAAGGPNTDDNLVCSCLRCNGKRGASCAHPKKSPLPWRTKFATPTSKELIEEPVHVELKLARMAYKNMKMRVEYLESITPYEVLKLWFLRWLFMKLKRGARA